MNKKTLLENIEIFCNTPSGIEDLRTAILDLAVSGKLVSQLSNEKSLRRNDGCQGPFVLPSEWSWQLLPNVTNDSGQVKPESPFTYIDVSSIDNKKGIISKDVQIISPEDAPSRARKRLQLGAVIYSTVRPYLKNIAIIDQVFEPPAIASTAFAILNPSADLDTRYLYYCLRSTYFTDFVESMQKGVAYPAINAGDLAKSLIPLPPLEEQARIVTTVEKLFGICEELQLKLQSQSFLATKTRESAVDSIATAQTPETFQVAWERISINWNLITHSIESIGSLRKLILALAAKGKLVVSPDRFSNTPVTLELKDVCKVSWGNLSLTKSSYSENGMHLAVSAAGPDGRIGFAEHKAYTPVLSAIGARCGTMFMPEEDFTAIKNTMTLTPNPEFLNNWYLLYAIMGSKLPRRGSAQPFMSKSDIERYRIRVPSLQEQELISHRVEELLKTCDLLEAKLIEANSISAKLSRSVFTGSA